MKTNGTTRKILLRKESGDATIITAILTVIITLFVFIIAIYAYTFWQQRLQRVYDIEIIAHRYLMEMELTDFSDQEKINDIYNNLTDELAACGVTEIDYGGSSESPVADGAKITLHIKGKINIKSLTVSGFTAVTVGDRDYDIDIEKSGTAMY